MRYAAFRFCKKHLPALQVAALIAWMMIGIPVLPKKIEFN